MHDPRRPHRSVARDPIVHGLSKREKKKKQAKCREFVECLQSTTAPGVRLHARLPPSYPVECDCPPNPPGAAAGTCSARQAGRVREARPPGDFARPGPVGNMSPVSRAVAASSCVEHLTQPRMPLAQRMACMHRAPTYSLAMPRHSATSRPSREKTICCLAAGVALPLTLIRVQPHSDTMHPLTSALAKSRPQFDSRPQACAHPSVLPPPVAPPLVGAAPPPPAARAG